MTKEEEDVPTTSTAARAPFSHLVFKPESEIQMLTRLLTAINHNEQERSLKRRYILKNFPDAKKKKPDHDFLRDNLYIPEMELRPEEDFHKMKEFVCSQTNDIPIPLTSADVLEQMSDNEILSVAPSLLSKLSFRAFRDLLSALSLITGPKSGKGKHLFRRDVAKDFEKHLANASSETLLEVASILRRPSSYMNKCLTTATVFPYLPKSVLKATRVVFWNLHKFPKYILRYILGILGCENQKASGTVLANRIRKVSDKIIKEHLKMTQVNGHLGQYDVFPLCIQRAMQFIQFSCKITFYSNGGIGRIVKPLSSKQLSLEEKCILAISHLNTMATRYWNDRMRKALKRFGDLNKRNRQEISKHIIKSVPQIYSDESLPDDVMDLLFVICACSWDAVAIAAMDVSAHVRSVIRDCYEVLIKVKDQESEAKSLLNECYVKIEEEEQEKNPGLNAAKSMEELPNIEEKDCDTAEHNGVCMQGTEKDLVLEEDIEKISDEVATAAYALVDTLLCRILTNAYSQSKTDPMTDVNISTQNLNVEKLVFNIANECTTFPRSVIESSERRLGICAGSPIHNSNPEE